MATLAVPGSVERPSAATGLRAVLVLVHRWLGLTLAAVLLLAGLTGALLVFQTEADAALNPQLWRIARSGPALSPQRLADVVAARDNRVTARWIPLDERPVRAADVWVDWRPGADGASAERAYDQMFIDPVDGQVLGTRAYSAAGPTRVGFVPFVHRLHSALLLPGRWGAWLLGAAGVLWLIDSAVGFALTLPRRRPRWRAWATSWQWKRGAASFRRTVDWHRAGGLWLWLTLVMMAVSSVALTLPDELFEPAVSRLSPVGAEVWEGRPAATAPPALDFDGALAMAARAARRAGIERPTSGLYYGPEASLYGVRFGKEEEAGLAPDWVYLDSRDGAVLRVERALDGTAGDVVTRAQLAIHAGRVLGLSSRVLTALLGLAIAVLSVTGVAIWWRKRSARLSAGHLGVARICR